MEPLSEIRDEIKELIRDYGLEEEQEYLIINLKNSRGKTRRIYILKRNYMRIVRPDGTFADYPIRDVVEAIIKYPHLRLSESLLLKKDD
jgi:hypothetical protein